MSEPNGQRQAEPICDTATETRKPHMREQVAFKQTICWNELCQRKLKQEIINELKPVIVKEVLEKMREDRRKEAAIRIS